MAAIAQPLCRLSGSVAVKRLQRVLVKNRKSKTDSFIITVHSQRMRLVPEAAPPDFGR